MTITLWKPEPNTITHQALGKLAEEAAELAKTCIRALIQGLDETNPATGKTNREEIADEIADVTAATIFVDEVTGIGYDTNRTRAKLEGFREWTALLHADDRKCDYNTALEDAAKIAELHADVLGYADEGPARLIAADIRARVVAMAENRNKTTICQACAGLGAFPSTGMDCAECFGGGQITASQQED